MLLQWNKDSWTHTVWLLNEFLLSVSNEHVQYFGEYQEVKKNHGPALPKISVVM